MAAGHSIGESHICIKISPTEAHEAEYVPSVAFLWNLLFSLPLLMQHAAESFAFQSTGASIPIGTDKSPVKDQWLLLWFFSLIPHENFIQEMPRLGFIDAETKHP